MLTYAGCIFFGFFLAFMGLMGVIIGSDNHWSSYHRQWYIPWNALIIVGGYMVAYGIR